MRPRLKKWSLCQPIVMAALCLAGSLAPAQQPCLTSPPPSNCVPAPGTIPSMPRADDLVLPGTSGAGEGLGMGAAEGTGMGAGTSDTASAAFAGLSSGAGVGASASLAAPGGYLDSAIPKTLFRLRYDAAFNINRPDRAEYFYATWKELSFHPHGVTGGGGIFFDPNAQGPTQLPAHVNFQEVSAYFEYAFANRLSAFVEVPVRFVHFLDIQEDNPESERKQNPRNLPAPGSPFFPEPGQRGVENPNENNTPGGLSDIHVGFKAALLADPDQYLTFQFRTYVNSGDPRTGLGTGHVSVEPSLLYYQRLTDQLVFQGQFTDWIPIGAGPGSGNVLMYGVGLGYDLYHRGNLRVTPITEFVGWTVLYGFESFFGTVTPAPTPGLDLPRTHGVADASGDTILNAKLGVRAYFGQGHDVYVGYGRSLTGEHWYRDIVRVEYRFSF